MNYYIIGKKFGELTAIEEFKIIKIYAGKPVSVYKIRCKCDCGNEVDVVKGSLTENNTASCGCIRKRNLSQISQKYHTLPFGVGAMNSLFSSYKTGAKARNILWELNIDQFKEITSKNCFYCGLPPKQSYAARCGRHRNEKVGDYIYNGIDRINNHMGYHIDNVVPCCKRCNRGKMDIEITTYYEWITRTYTHLQKNNFQLPDGTFFKNPSE